jgi:hypothetical protein
MHARLTIVAVAAFAAAIPRTEVQAGVVLDEATSGDFSDDRLAPVPEMHDLRALLARWNQPGGRTDLNGDGITNGDDLGILLAKWGNCGQ